MAVIGKEIKGDHYVEINKNDVRYSYVEIKWGFIFVEINQNDEISLSRD
jgi:hypothetical protein